MQTTEAEVMTGLKGTVHLEGVGVGEGGRWHPFTALPHLLVGKSEVMLLCHT